MATTPTKGTAPVDESSDYFKVRVPFQTTAHLLFQEKYILVEYKHIARFIPPGIYVLPSFDTLNCTFVVPLRRR